MHAANKKVNVTLSNATSEAVEHLTEDMPVLAEGSSYPFETKPENFIRCLYNQDDLHFSQAHSEINRIALGMSRTSLGGLSCWFGGERGAACSHLAPDDRSVC